MKTYFDKYREIPKTNAYLRDLLDSEYEGTEMEEDEVSAGNKEIQSRQFVQHRCKYHWA